MGSKGPSGNTTTTQTQTNPASTAQLPYLEDLWSGASNLAKTSSPYTTGLQNYAGNQATTTAPLAANVMPVAMDQYTNQIAQGNLGQAPANQLTTNAAGAVNQGLGFSSDLRGAANTALGQVSDWQNRFLNAGETANQTLQGYGSGAINALTGLAPSALAAGQPAQQGLMANASRALGGNPAFSSGLQGLASGAYINPSTNPAYAGMMQSATQPLVDQYQTAIAPQLASNFERSGRYGSGASINAQGQAQSGLGQALSNAVSGITNNAYNTGIQATGQAGQALGNIYNTGVGNVTNALTNSGQLAQAGVTNAGNLINQGYTTGGNLSAEGFKAQNAAMSNASTSGLGYLNAGLSGLASGANAAQAGYGTANTGLTGAATALNQGSQAQTNALSQASTFANYPETQYSAAYNAPWQPYSNLSSILGGAIGGSGTSTSTQPYYSNTGANILGGLSGGLGIASSLKNLFSDRRLKRDIKRVGTLRNGLPLYSFRYVGSKRRQIGLMADEVEQIHPEAVVAIGANRIKMVDYVKAVQ
jgi:hypothetical protein